MHTPLLLSTLLSLLTILAGLAHANPPSIDDLPARMQEALARSGSRGASYAVFDRTGVVATGAVGMANLDSGQAMTANTLMRAGSITKMLTAIAVLRMIERGRLDLQTPVRELLPEAPIVNPWESTDPIRVVHLLEHSAGFDDTSLGKLFVAQESAQGHLASLHADPRPLTARWRPGTMMSYANPGYAVLAAILEKQSGRVWEEIIRHEVLQPLGMADSVLTIAEATGRQHANGYRGKGMQSVPLLPMPDRAAGALWSTPEDLSRLGRFLMTDGASAPGVLAPETVRAMKSVHSTLAAKAGLEWGYGFGVQRSAALGLEWLGHDGSVYGAGALLRYQPQRGLGYVVMVNTDEVGALAEPLLQYIAGQPAPAPAPATETKRTLSGDIDGWYRRRDTRPELGAGINWLLGVVKVWRDPDDARQLLVQEVLSEPARYSSPDGRLLVGENNGLVRSVLIRDGERVGAIELNGGLFMERVPTFSALAPLFIGGFSLVALATVPFGRRRALRNPWLRRLPSLALLSLIVFVVLMFQLELTTLGQINAVAIGIFLATLLFPVFALAGLVLSLRQWKRESARVAKLRCLLGSLGACAIAVFLASFHGFALMIWRW
jgi:CubicO group peptidase (beta-lactamase class C family)